MPLYMPYEGKRFSTWWNLTTLIAIALSNTPKQVEDNIDLRLTYLLRQTHARGIYWLKKGEGIVCYMYIYERSLGK